MSPLKPAAELGAAEAPVHEELTRLTARIEELTARIDQLNAPPGSLPSPHTFLPTRADGPVMPYRTQTRSNP